MEKATEFAEIIKKIQEVEAVLRKLQKEMKWQANKRRKEVEE